LIEQMRLVLSAMSTIVYTTVCITVPPCVAPLLEAIESYYNSASVSEINCPDADILLNVSTVFFTCLL
ncbi:hypothetical protein ACVGW4_00200, partial [Enterobacter hormaechei]